MELYTKSDLQLVDKNIDKIIENIEEIRKQLYPRETDSADPASTSPVEKKQPDPDDVKKIVKIVLNFVKENKRKIYGGYGQNAVISAKNKADAFYTDDEIPDIDVYSFEPIEDLVKLCDILHENGFTDVFGKEAFHEGTYKVFTRGYNAIDLSYVPKMIYDNIPYVDINEIRYTSPVFSMIDLYRMMSEPLFSSFRWKKTIARLQLLQKYYPFQKITDNFPNVYSHKKNMSVAISIIEDYIMNNENVYLFGDLPYNLFVEKTKMSNINEVPVGIYQIVSTSYKHDAVKLITKLKNSGQKISYKEYYPFWSFTGYSVEIICEGEIIAKIYNNLKRCCPVLKMDHKGGQIQIGSFDYILLMEMVLSFRQKVMRDSNKKKYHDKIISNLITMREYYLKKNNKTLLDESIFQSFIIPCVGNAEDPIAKARKDRKEKKEKKLSSFSYKPVRELKTKWVFANTSGNEVHNAKNLKLDFTKAKNKSKNLIHE